MPRAILSLCVCLLFVGCSTKPATVKGSLSYEGKPFIPSNAGEVFVSFYGLDAAGDVDIFQKYAGVLHQDGTFEIASSSGELPVGKYRWSIDCAPGRVKEFEPFSLQKSKAEIELKPGPNQVVLDLSQK